MMDPSYALSEREFAVRLPGGIAPQVGEAILKDAGLPALGDFELVPADPEMAIFRFRAPRHDPQRAAEEIREFLAPHLPGREAAEVQVTPALIDQDGETVYPSGNITIRFHFSPTDDELRDFCRQNGLKLAKRNAYIPAQVSLTPSDARSYLPDLLGKVQQHPELKVWPETVSAFKRS